MANVSQPVSAARLKKIPRSSWKELSNKYKQNSHASSGYFGLLNFIKWVDIDPNADIEVFCLDDDWSTDGTFVAVLKESVIFCNTLTNDVKRLVRALKCLSLKRQYFINGVEARLMPAVNEFFKYNGLYKKDVVVISTVWMRMLKDDALKLKSQIPKNVTFAKLTEAHVSKIFDLYVLKQIMLPDLVKHLIKYQETLGAFDSDGNLIGWCFESAIGSISMINTVRNRRYEGLEMVLLVAMAKRLAEKDSKIYTVALAANFYWISELRRIGFRKYDNLFFAAPK